MATLAKLERLCRRRLKQLEPYLHPFIKKTFYLLNEQQIDHLNELLQLDDQILFECFFKQQKLDNPYRQGLVNLIKLYHQQNVAH